VIPFKKLYEDSTMPYGNRFVSGIASRELKANPIQMASLFNNNEQHPNEVKADKLIPNELSSVPEVLGQLELSIDNLINSYSTALQNPVFKSKNHLKAAVLLLKEFRRFYVGLVKITKKIVDNK
jgi:hypothetical protein